MSLAQILYPPPTDQGWEEWFQAHARHHEAIIGAVQATKGISLENLPLYPVNQSDMQDWLRAHQQMHNDMNGVLGIAGTDLSVLDLKDKKASEAWLFGHFLQHQNAGYSCGQPV